MDRWIIDLDKMTCRHKSINSRLFTIKYVKEENKVYSLYKCPVGMGDQWHECVKEIRDKYLHELDKHIDQLLLTE